MLSTVAFVAVWEHQRIRSKPAFQQSLIVFFALIAYEIAAVPARCVDGPPELLTTVAGSIPLLAALIWPIAIALLERGHSAERALR